MTLYYLDASAWVKRYYYEALGTAWVRGLFESNQSMACATLGLVEVTATLARKQREMKISAPGMMRLLGQLSSDWENFWQVDLDRRVVNAAASFARDFKLRGADALHLAAADLLW